MCSYHLSILCKPLCVAPSDITLPPCPPPLNHCVYSIQSLSCSGSEWFMGGMDPSQHQRAAFQGSGLKGEWDVSRERIGPLRSGVPASSCAWNLIYTVPPTFPSSLRGRSALGEDSQAWGSRRRACVPAWQTKLFFGSVHLKGLQTTPSPVLPCPFPSQRPKQSPSWWVRKT